MADKKPPKLEDATEILDEVNLAELEGAPSQRADVHFRLERERIWLRVKMPGWLGGTTFELNSEAFYGSPQSAALTTLLLVGAGSLLAAAAYAIGIPAMTALIAGLGAPVGTFALVRVLSGRWTR
jgi:hypothetical protein